jgi:hypothetical protein
MILIGNWVNNTVINTTIRNSSITDTISETVGNATFYQTMSSLLPHLSSCNGNPTPLSNSTYWRFEGIYSHNDNNSFTITITTNTSTIENQWGIK